MGNWKEVHDFLATTITSVYYQHSSHIRSKTQQLLWGKLTLSQLKPGQHLWGDVLDMHCLYFLHSIVFNVLNSFWALSNDNKSQNILYPVFRELISTWSHSFLTLFILLFSDLMSTAIDCATFCPTSLYLTQRHENSQVQAGQCSTSKRVSCACRNSFVLDSQNAFNPAQFRSCMQNISLMK